MSVKNGKAKANGKTNGAGQQGYDACKTSCASKMSLWAVIIAVIWGVCKVADKLNVSVFNWKDHRGMTVPWQWCSTPLSLAVTAKTTVCRRRTAAVMMVMS